MNPEKEKRLTKQNRKEKRQETEAALLSSRAPGKKKGAQGESAAPRSHAPSAQGRQKGEKKTAPENRQSQKRTAPAETEQSRKKTAPPEAEQSRKKTNPSPERSTQRGRGEKEGRGQRKAGAPQKKLRVCFLGGLSEIGKNMCLIEYGEDRVIVDAGLGFPDAEMLGVDVVIPDITYLKDKKVRAVLLTHGHEDHIGALPYLIDELACPIYGTPMTLGVLKKKLAECRLRQTPALRPVLAGDTVTLGVFRAEFIHVNHSIPDATAIALSSPVGTIFHTGDFKLDISPIDGQMMDLGRIAELGKAGVTLMLGESTNAEREGFTPSERSVRGSLERVFDKHPDRRLVVATFSSNVHRVQQIIETAYRHGRHVVVLGRSMVNIVETAVELGYITLPEPGILIGLGEMKNYKDSQLTLLTTGSQGEPMSGLYRMAFGLHDKIRLTERDVVVLSSSAIPGNEKDIGKIINALVKGGVRVETDDSMEGIHVSGHACRGELGLMLALVKPRFFMPIHGEDRHLAAHRELAEFMGIPGDRIFIGDVGRVLECDGESCGFAGSIPSGQVLIDGSGLGDVEQTVLRDRKILSEDGVCMVVTSLNLAERLVFAGPEIVTRGFVLNRDAEDLLSEARALADATLTRLLSKKGKLDLPELRAALKDALSGFFYRKTRRRPMILPVVMDI